MKITAIITEYNPFHKGHEFHLENAKKDTNCDGIICIMSGNFVQRGLPAITDKWTRASMALEAGVDLVIELPTLFATASAEHFSFGAVSILDSLNIVDNLYFGSEVGSTDFLTMIAEILATEPLEFKNFLKNHLDEGLAFPKARANALEQYLHLKNYNELTSDDIHKTLNSSNNILGIEYCKSLYKLKSNIKAATLKREGSSYNDTDTMQDKFASATAIRASIFENNSLHHIKEFLPNYTYNILSSKKHFSNIDIMFEHIKYNLLLYPSLIYSLYDANEGLDNKILNEISKATSFNDLITRCKSKRYTYTRISRCLCHIYLGINKSLYSLIKERPNYARVLALNSTGAQILKKIKKSSDLEIITKVPRKLEDPLLSLDVKATNLYALVNKDVKISSDYLISPIIKKDF